jgi:hypothetical protein
MTGVRRTFSELPGWIFELEELSASVFRARGTDRSGRRVESIGIDPEAVVDYCRSAALELVNSTFMPTVPATGPPSPGG